MKYRTKLFKNIKPFNTGMLKVSEIHSIYYEESGNKKGVPILFVHGGPGSSSSDQSRRYFDPKFYRIIVFDQRGCGKSIPSAEIRENTTFDLVKDMEKLREHLNIESWILFGGSWGSTLSLIYSINHSKNVLGLILRGIFLGRKEDDYYLYQEGSSYYFPEAYEEYRNFIPKSEQANLIEAYNKYLNSSNLDIAYKASYQWAKWELGLITLNPIKNIEKILSSDKKSNLELARLENHYFINHLFLNDDNYILNNIEPIKNIKTIIIHGRYDMDCRPIGAFLLSKKMNNCELKIVDSAGHSTKDKPISNELVIATEKFKKYLKQRNILK